MNLTINMRGSEMGINIDQKEIDELLRSAVKQSISKNASVKTVSLPGDLVNEAYVAEPKKFKQVTEFVTQKTKDAHTELYKSYVESLNKVSAELDTAKRSEANPRHSEYKSLKKDEVFNLNATWLHELYFANCFDPHSEITMDSLSYLRLERDFGTFEDWQRDFMACANASGIGWAVCGYHLFLRRYVNTFVCSHNKNVMLGLYPVIVLDMWEHAYRDYYTDKNSYVVSQMREINWKVVEERVNKAEQIAQVLK
jgi:Fe-Mn family superoxide dismutase